MEKIKVVIKRVGQSPIVTAIENDLKTSQRLVGGRIEIVSVANGIDMIVNEEGKMNGNKPNFYFTQNGYTDLIFGDVLFTGVNYEAGTQESLTDGQIQYVLDWLNTCRKPKGDEQGEEFIRYYIDI
ncbi:DUF3846 domain-containing protein [Megasphaera stantonii]|uniref:DUF3846 domain-containing protein n=1 Tax=Megasphaera stantonii TaxID=2144175 RepID=UPI001D63462D|nr:DUF3846 domain-containing protein [Megasphaera stantonii]HJE82849.1 DUF3846 domain-containing protein [Megasphaera stantonii]